MDTKRDGKELTGATLAIYWSAIGLGLTIPWTVHLVQEMYVRPQEAARVFKIFRVLLFAPGYNLFLQGILSAIPFVVFAVFTLVHLGTGMNLGRVIAYRRLAGVIGAGLTVLGLSLWAHIGLAIHPDAQGALVFFFLPFYALILMPFGYGVGRLLGKWLVKQAV